MNQQLKSLIGLEDRDFCFLIGHVRWKLRHWCYLHFVLPGERLVVEEIRSLKCEVVVENLTLAPKESADHPVLLSRIDTQWNRIANDRSLPQKPTTYVLLLDRLDTGLEETKQ